MGKGWGRAIHSLPGPFHRLPVPVNDGQVTTRQHPQVSKANCTEMSTEATRTFSILPPLLYQQVRRRRSSGIQEKGQSCFFFVLFCSLSCTVMKVLLIAIFRVSVFQVCLFVCLFVVKISHKWIGISVHKFILECYQGIILN